MNKCMFSGRKIKVDIGEAVQATELNISTRHTWQHNDIFSMFFVCYEI
jgi:hypothetical protein